MQKISGIPVSLLWTIFWDFRHIGETFAGISTSKHRGQGPGFDSRRARVQHILLDIDDEKDEPEEHKDDEDEDNEDNEDGYEDEDELK